MYMHLYIYTYMSGAFAMLFRVVLNRKVVGRGAASDRTKQEEEDVVVFGGHYR